MNCFVGNLFIRIVFNWGLFFMMKDSIKFFVFFFLLWMIFMVILVVLFFSIFVEIFNNELFVKEILGFLLVVVGCIEILIVMGTWCILLFIFRWKVLLVFWFLLCW